MKHFILVISLCAWSALDGFPGFQIGYSVKSVDVYICVSKTASRYHCTESCNGLNRCSHKIEKVSVAEARNRGYSLCGFED